MIRNRSLLSLCLGIGICSAASSGCSLLVDSDRVQCHTDAECAARGSAFLGKVCIDSLCVPDPTWSCLDEPVSLDVQASTVHVVLTLENLVSQKVEPGVGLTLCAKVDGECRIKQGTFSSDETGKVDVALPGGFDGYFETARDGLYPSLFFPPNTRRQRAPGTLPMVPDVILGEMMGRLGVGLSEDRTVVWTTALDCLGRPAPGMVLTIPDADEATVSYRIAGGLPSLSAATTDETGQAGFVNVKPGGVYITSTIAASGRKAGSVAVQARTGYLTMVLVMPNGA